ncbi:hypothetical protein M9H77_07328 [Catharanthus roseus]|uniref:Uncharacterized protein n=2 Tax=Catharanthus roseus TaxID=4058 RepID=A0ACC0BUV6_CATRO|nr:hypothetical protein M9H77_07326 [Catharanthus roseus]KAI5676378.1 hypothetical protein M9H77_07328 [Catharanthus roseus]
MKIRDKDKTTDNPTYGGTLDYVNKFHVDNFSMEDLDLCLKLFGLNRIAECNYIMQWKDGEIHMMTIMSETDVSLMCGDGEKTGAPDIYVVVERGSWNRLPKKIGKRLELVEDGGASVPPSKKTRTLKKGQNRKLLSHGRESLAGSFEADVSLNMGSNEQLKNKQKEAVEGCIKKQVQKEVKGGAEAAGSVGEGKGAARVQEEVKGCAEVAGDDKQSTGVSSFCDSEYAISDEDVRIWCNLEKQRQKNSNEAGPSQVRQEEVALGGDEDQQPLAIIAR